MEYRRRPRRTRQRRVRQDSYVGTVICVVFLFAAIVYLIGMSSAGTWMAKTVVAPVFRTLGIPQSSADTSFDSAAETVTSVTTLVTETLKFPESTRYALQMGVYSSLENASKQAAALQSLGAGGYICSDNEKYRVLAACYPDETSISTVREQLSAEGLESTSYLIGRNATEWIVTAEQSQIDILSDAMQALINLGDRIYTLIYAFDSEKQSVSVGRTALTSLRAELQEHHSLIKSSLNSNSVSRHLLTCYDAILTAIEDAASYDGEETVAFSAKLKYAHLAVEDAIRSFVSAIENE